MIGRVFLGLYKTKDMENLIREKLTKKISRVNRPSFCPTLPSKASIPERQRRTSRTYGSRISRWKGSAGWKPMSDIQASAGWKLPRPPELSWEVG